jgi:poly(3-hydroxybutyrate) depolymerase
MDFEFQISNFKWIAVVLLTVAWPGRLPALDQVEAVKLSREYLASRDSAERRRLATTLDEYQGDIEPVIQELRAQTFQPIKSGYHPQEHFSVPELRKKHPRDLLYFMVPKDYSPDHPTGLIVFLHGGGRTTSRQAPRVFMNLPEENEPAHSYRLGDLFAATGMIAVGPSAPWNEDSPYRWCLRETDSYLADVIRECKSRFRIDPDRVFLMGHSMGGFGVYHHLQRQPDQFAAALVNSGSWSLGYWPVIRGTPLWIVQGVQDAREGVRWHYTDVAYGRWTDQLLSQEKLDYRYLEHHGKHAVSYGRPGIAQFLEAAPQMRRDPYFPHVVLASPLGFKKSYCFPVEHNRWLTLNGTVPGDIEYDELISSGNDFKSWRLEHRKSKRPGAAIEAINRGDNTILVTTQNVAKFTVWLHPRMIDEKKPVTIIVNGKTRFTERVKPSLATALESYERRGDWGLIYPIRIELVE